MLGEVVRGKAHNVATENSGWHSVMTVLWGLRHVILEFALQTTKRVNVVNRLNIKRNIGYYYKNVRWMILRIRISCAS